MNYALFNPDGTMLTRLVSDLHVIPKDAVEIHDIDLWKRLICECDGIWTRRSDGKIIKKPLPLVELSTDVVERQRLAAYADSETGSDRHFSEATRMQTMGEPGWEAVRNRAIKRFHEIQQQFPWPPSNKTSKK